MRSGVHVDSDAWAYRHLHDRPTWSPIADVVVYERYGCDGTNQIRMINTVTQKDSLVIQDDPATDKTYSSPDSPLTESGF